MPKKTLALIVGLIIVTVVLFVIALRTGNKQTQTQITQTPTAIPTPTPAVHTILTLSPNPVEVASGKQGTVQVLIDTSVDKVTAVQLELTYDPQAVANLKIAPGKLFPNAVVLINKNDIKTGRVTYAFGIQPGQDTVNGQGEVATITFTAKGAVGTQSPLTVLPNTLVTAQGVTNSVLKASSGTIISVVAKEPPVTIVVPAQ